ncbi:MAG TPA: hypothetical protein VIK26_10530 [Clostridium sp.]
MGKFKRTFAITILLSISFILIACGSKDNSQTVTKIEVKEAIPKSIEKEEFNKMLSNLDANLFKLKADVNIDKNDENHIDFIVNVNANGDAVAYTIARYYYEQVIELNKETITDENKDKVRIILRTTNKDVKAWMYEGKDEINLLI